MRKHVENLSVCPGALCGCADAMSLVGIGVLKSFWMAGIKFYLFSLEGKPGDVCQREPRAAGSRQPAHGRAGR